MSPRIVSVDARVRVLPPSTPAVLAVAARGGGPPSGVTHTRTVQRRRTANCQPGNPNPGTENP